MIGEANDKLDLFLNIMKNPDKNFEDLINAGFTADNSELLSKDVYQNDAEIKDFYTNSNGTFDLDRFDKDYEVISQIQQNLQHLKDYGKQINYFSYHRDNFLVDEKKRRKGYDFEIFRALNPFEQTAGIVQLGKAENPIKTAAEIAQGELVHNLKTNTWEESPEEASFFDNVLSETKVLAMYEEDGVHEDPITGEKVIHLKGDLKFNANGKPYYETLNGRDVYGRQVLSNFDVLTKEDSNWNRYDFFDNDGYDKSVIGNVVKTAVVVAPMFIPYIGPVYTGASVLVNAVGLFGTLGKIASSNDWMNQDTTKWFNNLEGWSKSMNTLDSRSEYAKQHMWSMENMIGLVGDVITLLKEQRWIFEYGPLFFNPNWNATKAIASKKGIDFDKLEKNFANRLYGSKFHELLKSAGKTPALDASTVIRMEARRQAQDYFTKSQKISEVISKLYMTGITTLDGYSEAKAAGADDVTAALYALGYAAGEYAIINSRLGDWILPEKRVSVAMDEKTATTLVNSLARSKPAQNATKAEKMNWIQRVIDFGKNKLNGDYIVGVKNLSLTIMDNMLAGAMAEGLEEVTEEFWADLSKSLYNATQYLRGEEDTYMKAWENVFDRYVMSAVGGAVGGGITALDLDVMNLLNKDMTFNEAVQRFITMVRNNSKTHELDQFMKTVAKMDFGNTEIVNGLSGNDLVRQSLNQFTLFINDVINAENANLSDDHILHKVSKELRDDFKWAQLMSPLYKEGTDSEGKPTMTAIENSVIGAKILQDINNDLAIILGDAAATYVEENSKTDAEQRKEEKAPKKEKSDTDKDSRVEKARKHLLDTLSGALNYEYAQLFLYEYTHMGDRLVPSTFRAFVKMKTGKHLEEFDEEQKAKLKELYEATRKNRADLLMFLANSHQQISELSKETVEKLAEIYKQNALNELLQHLTKFLEKIVSFNEDGISDDLFLEVFSTIYDNLEAWNAGVYTPEGEKVLNPDGSLKMQTLGLYTALNSAFGTAEDYEGFERYFFNVKPIEVTDDPEVLEKKKQLLEYNEQIKKYIQFTQAIKQLGRLVEFYEKLGFINSELKQTLYHLTDKLNKNRTKIELLANRYGDILKSLNKQYFALEEIEDSFYTFINSLFPEKTFTYTPDTTEGKTEEQVKLEKKENIIAQFVNYVQNEAKDTVIGQEILNMIDSGDLDLNNDANLADAFVMMANNLSNLDEVSLNHDKIASRDIVDQMLLGFVQGIDGISREHIYNEKIEAIELLQAELLLSLEITEQTRNKLNSLTHTLIEEDLNLFAFSIGEDAIFTNLLESLNDYLFQTRNSVDSVMLNDTLSKRIDDALWLISMYEDTLNTARTVLYDTTNVWGYNKTLNSIAKKVKSEKELPTLAEIDSETADVFLQDLSLYKKKLQFLKKLYAVNAGLKFAVNDRVELNTAYIFLSKLKKWIGSLEPLLGVEGLDELQQAVNELTVVDKFFDGTNKNFNLSLEDKINMTKERIKIEEALYKFFNKNVNNLSYEVLKRLFVPKDFTISDLFKSKPTIINEKTEDVSFLEFINYLATRAAISSNALRYEVATVIQDEIASESPKKIVPIPTQVEAVFYPYAKFANPKMVAKFTKFKRLLLEETVNNVTKEQLLELNRLGLSPFKKGILDNSNIEEALQRFKENVTSLEAYSEFDDVFSLVEGMPGTGKSFGVDDLIAKMLAKHHKEYLKDAIVINTTSETAENLAEALKIKTSYTIEEFLTKTMDKHTPVGVNADGELDVKEGVHYKIISGTQIDAIAEPKEGLVLPQVIFVDELPTLNRIQILELTKLARKYGIEILATGDYNQTTPIGQIVIGEDKRPLKVTRAAYFPSTKLGVSMRTDNSQKTNNINQAQIAVDTAQYEPDEDVDLTLTYTLDELGIFGDKVFFTSNTDITDDLLLAILEDIDIMIKTLKKDKKGNPQKINYIFSNSNSKLYKKLSLDNKYKEYIQFHAGNTSQGKEGLYWIVENDREVSKLSTYLLELYTGISRSELGSIIIASSNYTGNLAKLTLKNTKTSVRINEGFSEEIKQRQLEKLIKFYGALTLNENLVEILRNKPESIKNSLIEELRKVEADASLTDDPIYYTIKSEKPLVIKVGDDEITISKKDLINKIKTENYRLKETIDPEKPKSVKQEIVDDKTNKGLADQLNDELSRKRTNSLSRILSQENQEVINFYLYLYSAFSMETSVEVDENGRIRLADDGKNLSTDPTDSRVDNIIGLYKYYNGNLDYYTLHEKLNQLRLAFLTNADKNSLTEVVYSVLDIPTELRDLLYITFGYKKTNATVKEDGNRELEEVYAKANKTNKETIEYNALGGSRSNEVGVNNLVVNIGFNNFGDFLEIPLMRFASPISIMYQTDENGKYLFLELIDFWNSKELRNDPTFIKCNKLIEKFKSNKKYERIIREFRFYVLPNSNYFSISAIDSDWLPASHLINLGPQVITNAGLEFYNETGFEFSNNAANSWIGISLFRDNFRDVMQISRVKMLTNEEIRGVNVTGHINLGFPFILTKLGKSNLDIELVDENLMDEFLEDIKNGNTSSSKIRVVYLAKPKIALDSYLQKVYNLIFYKGSKENKVYTAFGNIFTTYKILEALFRNYDEASGILEHDVVRTKVVKKLIDEVSQIKSDKNAPYTKEEIEQVVAKLKETFSSEGYDKNVKISFEGAEISVKTLFDSYLANLLKKSDRDTSLDLNKVNEVVKRVLGVNSSLEYIYADGIKFKEVDGIATLEDSYLLDSSESGLTSEEFFVHAKVTLPMFFNPSQDFVQKFMDEFLVKNKYSRHNFSYFGVKMLKDSVLGNRVVKSNKYKYGKSKIETTNKPGGENKPLTIDELIQTINLALDTFEQSKKTIPDAKKLVTTVNRALNNINNIDYNYATDQIFVNMFNVLLLNGILINIADTILYYNLKTRPYNLRGKFVEGKTDTGDLLIVFEQGGNLFTYVARITKNGELDLTKIQDSVVVQESKTYKEQLDALILDEAFQNLIKGDILLQKMFARLHYDNFNESFYDVLMQQSASKRKAFLETLRDKIKDSSELTDLVLMLNELITPSHCL